MPLSKSVRAIVSASLVAIAAMSVSASALKKSALQKNEPRAVREIRAVLDKQVEAWNRRDLEGFMKGYWQSPDLTFYSTSTITSGWQQTLGRYKDRYQGEGREMGTLNFSDVKIEMLGTQSAFVRGRWHLKMGNGEAGGFFTLIFRKLADGWKIVHDHTSSSS